MIDSTAGQPRWNTELATPSARTSTRGTALRRESCALIWSQWCVVSKWRMSMGCGSHQHSWAKLELWRTPNLRTTYFHAF